MSAVTEQMRAEYDALWMQCFELGAELDGTECYAELLEIKDQLTQQQCAA